MTPRLLISPCGCTSLIDLDAKGLMITDGNNLPTTEIQIISLSLNSVEFEISETFESLTAFVAFLNTTFVILHNLEGYFVYEADGNLYYTNPENFNTGEVMAILRRQKLQFIIGNAEGDGIPLANGITVITRSEWQGASDINASLGGLVAYENSEYTFDPVDGTIHAAGPYETVGFNDTILQVTFNQSQG